MKKPSQSRCLSSDIARIVRSCRPAGGEAKRPWLSMPLLLGSILATPGYAANFTVNVVDQNGSPVSGFRWQLQEDTTFPVDPNNPATLPQNRLSTSFHKSYHPLAHHADGTAVKGNSDTASASVTNVPAGRYYISVLPYEGNTMSGATVTLDGTANPTVTVTVSSYPIPTAEITVYLFQDNYPINGMPDLPKEANPIAGQPGHVDWTAFSVNLEEPAGRYGHNGGPVSQDAFGNPLGTKYDSLGNVMQLGDGSLHPNPDGTLTIKNLSPGKYGVVVNPPTGSTWVQTNTIEGTRVNDAWVKANEPPVFVEFGPPGPHVFFGFVKSTADGGFPPLGGTASISGNVTDMHMSRSPAVQFFSGRPFPQCWIGINETVAGIPGKGVYSAPCDANSNFTVTGLAPGSYELKVFDKPLDMVFASMAFTVDAGGSTCNNGQSCNFGEVSVFNWFSRLKSSVFNDTNKNGFKDSNETGVPSGTAAVNLRWRDGSIYQSFPVDATGEAPFDEVFPFFHWLVAEVSSSTKKATGATVVVDAGGPVNKASTAFPGYGELNPQPQAAINPNTGDNLSRTETGPVLTQGMQGFLGQTNVMQFGKTEYKTFDFSSFPATYIGENGGISGSVLYGVTRSEDDPTAAVANTWEPGIPRVQVALYADGDVDCPSRTFPTDACDIDWNGNGTKEVNDNIIDDVNRNGAIDLADIDNAPLGWAQGGLKGPEDVDRNGDGLFDYGDALAIDWTDSWDDNLPTNCAGQNLLPGLADTACFDGLRNFNQVRPAVFDGKYAFTGYNLAKLPLAVQTKLNGFYAQPKVAATGFTGLLPADYIVQAAQPPGYDIVKEEDKNVTLGDAYTPSTQALPAACVGDAHVVPPFLSLATKDGSGAAAQLISAAYSDKVAPFAGQTRPLCDRRMVPLSAAQNASANFFLKTDVPVVANVAGGILNDLGNEFNPNTPNFGEKFAPPHMPVAFYDWNGKLVSRIYADQYGKFNAVLPSTSTADRPLPSGMAPSMLVSCMNDAGPIPDPNNPGQTMIDPFYNPQFSQFCYTFEYMPGVATYLDTPVVPVAAHANPSTHPVDCERPTQTPMIDQVTRAVANGGGGPFALAGQRIEITTPGGAVQVPNPNWDGTINTTQTITRDYSFGTSPSVYIENASGQRTSLTNVTSNGNTISAQIPSFGVAAGDYQVIVKRSNGAETPIGTTLTVGVSETAVRKADGTNGSVWRVPDQFPTIQQAIDNAAAGDLILVAPGIYNELVIMWKPVKLQGWGAGATTINARQVPTENIIAWRNKARTLVANGSISKLPGQTIGIPGFPALDEGAFPTEEGAGIFVAGVSTGANSFGAAANKGARIDGFSIIGASNGGGIVVNGYAQDMAISNNRLSGNSGIYSGGIRIGHPVASHQEAGVAVYDDAVNDRIRIHHNHVAQNGSTFDGAGGIALNTGSDNYQVKNNWVCGNYAQGNGGGIGHQGLSNDGLMQDNYVIFNEAFKQLGTVAGGGIYVGGQPALQADPTTGLLLSPGAGNNLVIDSNIIRGNLAGAGDGGGLMIANLNGLDVVANPGNRTPWSDVGIYNNMITNNVSGLAGGGISIGDSLVIDLRNNTVAHNESTATAALAFTPGSPSRSNALPAGVVSRVHSPAMSALMNTSGLPISIPTNRQTQWLSFSDPVMENDLIYQNRSWFWLNYDNPATPVIETGLFPSNCTTAPTGCSLADMNALSDDVAVLDGVVDTGKIMNISYSLFSNNADNQLEYIGKNHNITGNPAFVNGYHNGPRDSTLAMPEFTTLQTAGAFDEGGNFIQVAYGPLSIVDTVADPVGNPNGTVLFDYHIASTSAAVNTGVNVGSNPYLAVDIDGDSRKTLLNILLGLLADVDIGADERPSL